MTASRRDTLVRALLVTEQMRMAARPDGAAWRSAWRARERWFDRWTRWGHGLYDDLQARMDLQGMIHQAQREWEKTTKTRWLRKDTPTPPDPSKIVQMYGLSDPQTWASGALASYLGMALDTGADAGQFTLDALGVNKTFAWTHPRNIAQSIYATHGSKVILNTAGQYQEQLAKLVIDATKPRSPKTIGQLADEIKTEWSQLAKWQAERIARTETANIWETTNYNVMRANGITSYEVLLASGPSIGVDVAGACDYCVQQAAQGTYSMDDTSAYPPYHPNCRCTAIPVLQNEDGTYWLPPQDPYTGGDLEDPVALTEDIRGGA